MAREGHNSNEETFADLYRDDLLWAQAIVSDHCLKERDHKFIEPLVGLLNQGIYDQEEEENCQSKEWSMRFSAVCNSLLLQYCCSLQELVGLALALVLEFKLTYLQFRREVDVRNPRHGVTATQFPRSIICTVGPVSSHFSSTTVHVS